MGPRYAQCNFASGLPHGHQIKAKPKPKPKLTDADRHKRFLDIARQVRASDDPKAFDKAFRKVTAEPLKKATTTK